ncbi:fertilization-influencing membrane protein [Sorex araneus]|uniref:fertilization-influencing membrane protein n=1 Tax=Sorex araneus TaxID=42254 RepID=UPI002433EDD3|nr:fertilization-influencing membrane protein [Sorex araneus]
MTSQTEPARAGCGSALGTMRLWAWQWAWLAGLGAVETAPSLQRAKAWAVPTESPDPPDFFDYPDSDHARLLAVARFIGENPDLFASSESGSGFFNHILVGSLVLAFLFLLFQFCTHM